MAMVYVQNIDGKPLMPTTRCGHVRLLLKKRKAKVVVLYQNKLHVTNGTHCNGTRAILENKKSIAVSKLTCIAHAGAWRKIA